MTFCVAIESCPGLAGRCLPGLKAVSSKAVTAVNPRRVTGSVQLDEALRGDPGVKLWDYGIGIRAGRHVGEFAVWIEVHPANSTGNAEEVLEKLRWLRAWIRQSPELMELTNANPGFRFVWVATGPVKRPLAGSSLARRLAQSGLHLVTYIDVTASSSTA